MDRITVNLSDAQYEWVRAESDARDTSMSAVLRDLVDAHRDAPADASCDALAELTERVADLEATVDRLASDDDAPAPHTEASAEPPETTQGAPEGADAVSGDPTPSERDVDLAAPIDERLPTWGTEWTEHVEARRQVGRETLAWLRDRDRPASGGDFRDALLPKHSIEGQNETTWWRKTARPALQAAVDAGLVEYREGYHDYRWLDEA